MNARITRALTAVALVLTVSVHVGWLTRTADAQTRGQATWSARTPWGDPEFQGEWTSEGEYGVPFERPPQFGTQTVPDRRGIRQAPRRRPHPRRTRPGARSTCSPAKSTRRTRRSRIGANTTRHHAAHRSSSIHPMDVCRRESRRPGRFPCSGAAASRAASRAIRTRTTASASVASCTAEAFPTRCFRRSTTRTCASSRARDSSPSV